MARRLYPHKRLRYWYSYDIDEVCSLYADLSLHPQTVRKWMKEGLPTVDKSKPALVYGNELIQHLKQNNQANKTRTAFDECYCMKCQDARAYLRNQISLEQTSQFLRVQGLCRECKSRMFKSYKLRDWALLRKQFKLVGVSELYDDANSTAKTHLLVQDETASSEPLQSDLFQ